MPMSGTAFRDGDQLVNNIPDLLLPGGHGVDRGPRDAFRGGGAFQPKESFSNKKKNIFIIVVVSLIGA